jgi:hypothetical protein
MRLVSASFSSACAATAERLKCVVVCEVAFKRERKLRINREMYDSSTQSVESSFKRHNIPTKYTN